MVEGKGLSAVLADCLLVPGYLESLPDSLLHPFAGIPSALLQHLG